MLAKLSTPSATPCFYATPQDETHALGSIVPGINSIMYAITTHLEELLEPLIGKRNHHINNSKQLVEKLQETVLEDGEVLTL